LVALATNWAGNITYGARGIHRPGSLDELQALVSSSDRIRALGSRHSFTSLPDSEGELVQLDALPAGIEIDSEHRSVSVGAGVTYGALAEHLHRAGWALSNLASLPHISVAGTVATGTHGSGNANQALSAAVSALDLVGPDGTLRAWRRGEQDFDGSVVSLGLLGIVTRLVLDVEPTYEVSSTQFTGIGWDTLDERFDDLMAAAYSVSLFTKWTGGIGQAWFKSRGTTPVTEVVGARPATETLHILSGADPAAITQQHGVPGPWHERLAHFRMEFTPSRGQELQSEYYLPREEARAAIASLRELGPLLAPLLQSAEIRTLAADDSWLSGAYARDTVGFHFTWVRDVPAVYDVLPLVEAGLVPLGARPHWGKCFTMTGEELLAAYPRLPDFGRLRDALDPGRKFANRFTDRLLSAL
jgi:xylitol oxidase